MKIKDKFLLYLVSLVALAGIFGSFFWDSVAGVVAILAIGWVIVTLLILQRLQIAKLQERTLMVVRQGKSNAALNPANRVPETKETKPENTLETRKILDILQAQQVSMEILAARLDENTEKHSE